jgi:hypothetical protein
MEAGAQHNAPSASPLLPKTSHTALVDHALKDETVLKAGSLSKRAAHTRTWQKRWFVLRPYGLAYYKDNKEYETRRVITLDSISGVSTKQHIEHEGFSMSPTKSKRGKPLLTFFIRSRRLELLAETQEEAESWAAALKQAIAVNIRQGASAGRNDVPDTEDACILSETEDEGPATSTSQEPEKVVMQGYLKHLLHYDHHSAFHSPTERTGRSSLGALANMVKHPIHAAHRSRSASMGHKQARKMRGKRYWCVLRSHSGLFLYADPQEYEVVDILPLSEMVDWTDLELPEYVELRQTLTAASQGSSESEDDKEGRLYVLQIILNEESRIFAAPSETLLDEWLGALQSRIEWQRARRSSGAGIEAKAT